MKTMSSEIKKVFTRVREAQVQLQGMINSQDWVDEARKYAKRQGKEVKKLFGSDVAKVKKFLEKERKELERFQKQIPGEVKKIQKFVNSQKKEFEKLLSQVGKMGLSKKKTRKPSTLKAKAKKNGSATKKKSASSVSATGGSSEMSASL
jgi:hypothetical protein